MLIEKLESRQLLSVNAVVAGDTLFVTGDSANNVLFVSIEGAQFPRASVHLGIHRTEIYNSQNGGLFPSQIVIHLGAGADRLSVDQLFDSQLPVTVRGGDGNDKIHLNGPKGFSTHVWGERGNDNIVLGEINKGGVVDFSPEWVHRAEVHAGAGNDVIKFHSRPKPNQPPLPSVAKLHGNAG